MTRRPIEHPDTLSPPGSDLHPAGTHPPSAHRRQGASYTPSAVDRTAEIPETEWVHGYEFELYDAEDLYETLRTWAVRIHGGPIELTDQERQGLAAAARLLARVCEGTV